MLVKVWGWKIIIRYLKKLMTNATAWFRHFSLFCSHIAVDDSRFALNSTEATLLPMWAGEAETQGTGNREMFPWFLNLLIHPNRKPKWTCLPPIIHFTPSRQYLDLTFSMALTRYIEFCKSFHSGTVQFIHRSILCSPIIWKFIWT
jgi:hypothetical protein